MNSLKDLVNKDTVERDEIIAVAGTNEKTVWDTLAVENPQHAVISAENEVVAIKKSAEQLETIKAVVNEKTVLLDYGSGYGRVAKYLLPQQKLAGYIALDSSRSMLELFRDRYKKTPEEQLTPALFVQADIHSIPLQNDSVDVVIVCAVFLHNHKRIVREAIKEIHRVLQPGGKVLVLASLPAGKNLMGVQGYCYQWYLSKRGRGEENGPVRYYTNEEVNQLFNSFSSHTTKAVGFAVIPKALIGLPKVMNRLWSRYVAKPINWLLEKITPRSLRVYAAMYYDVTATK